MTMFKVAFMLLLGSFPCAMSATGLTYAPLTAPAPVVQQDLEGKYLATKPNGDAIVPGATVEVTIKRTWWGYVSTMVLVQEGVRTELSREAMTIVSTTNGYEGTNSAGNKGKFTPKGDGAWEVEMTSGPNTGNKTKITPIRD